MDKKKHLGFDVFFLFDYDFYSFTNLIVFPSIFKKYNPAGKWDTSIVISDIPLPPSKWEFSPLEGRLRGEVPSLLEMKVCLIINCLQK